MDIEETTPNYISIGNKYCEFLILYNRLKKFASNKKEYSIKLLTDDEKDKYIDDINRFYQCNQELFNG